MADHTTLWLVLVMSFSAGSFFALASWPAALPPAPHSCWACTQSENALFCVPSVAQTCFFVAGAAKAASPPMAACAASQEFTDWFKYLSAMACRLSRFCLSCGAQVCKARLTMKGGALWIMALPTFTNWSELTWENPPINMSIPEQPALIEGTVTLTNCASTMGVRTNKLPPV